MNKIKVKSLDSLTCFDCDDKEDVIEVLRDQYVHSDVVLSEMLEDYEIIGLSVQDVVTVFAKLINELDGDELMQRKFGGSDKCDLIEEVERWVE